MRNTPHIPEWRGRGFTLLELLIASVLAVFLAALTAQMWRFFSAQTIDLSRRATAAQELKFALENLRGDMGAVNWALRVSDNRILISRYSSNGGDNLVEYYPDGSTLCRYDHVTGVAIPVAGNVSSFQVDNLGGSVIQVIVTVTCGQTTRQATLLWSTS